MVLPLALSVASPFSFGSAQEPSSISFDADHAQTTRDIVEYLSKAHYGKKNFDDALSGQYLDNLLTTLDPNKYYFFASDIASFELYRTQFDDLMSGGNLDKPLEIIQLYFKRTSERLEQAIELLESDDFQFDYERQESIGFEEDSRSWAETEAIMDDYWRKRLKFNVLNLVLSGDTQQEAREAITKRYRNQLQRLEQQSTEDVYEILINALAELYDPHTSYMAPRTQEAFNINMSLSLEGIGAVLQMDEGYTKVVRLIKAGPADKTGELMPADRIVAVGQGSSGEMVDVIGWRLDDVVDLIRGPKNTVVRLKLKPANNIGSEDFKTIAITRGKVKLEEQSAQKAVFDLVDDQGELHKVGVIHIPAFYVDFEAYRRKDPNFKSTTRDVFRLLQELDQENIDGLIVDLRDNGGGSLQEAATLTDLFIDQGPVVQIRQSNNRILRNYTSRLPAVYRGPLVVLTNRLSASASEIFAGAIQDYQRGLIVGTQSFGKGTVQALVGVHEGQLKITESKFYRVSGESTQHRGVIPDILYPALINADDVGESSYETALPWDQIHPVNHRAYFNIDAVLPVLRSKHEQRKIDDPDLAFLVRQSQLLQENRQEKQISLNLKQRQQERAEAESEALASENQRRQGKGQQPFTSLEQWREDSKASEEGSDSPYLDNAISIDEDPLLSESGYILLDWLNLSDGKRVAQHSK
ncbi:MAG: carboxy terminal-processing peptidase [Candidatus Pelagadaptatus aseana]